MDNTYKPTKRLLPLIAALSLTFSLAACGGGGGPQAAPVVVTPPTPAERIASLEASGALPKLDRSTVVTGADANANGVRDDIDAWIAAKNFPVARAKALTRAAKTAQAALTVTTTNTAAVRSIALQGARDINCILTVFSDDSASNGGYEFTRQIQAYTYNTKARILAFNSFNQSLKGMVLALPEGDTCDE